MRHCRKIDQRQPMVIIYKNFEELDSHMLHAKFHIIGLLVLGKMILKVFTILSRGSHVYHLTLLIHKIFAPSTYLLMEALTS